MATPRYYVGKGKVYLGSIVDGVNQGFDWLGNVPELTLSTEEQTIEHKESYTGKNLTDKIVGVGQSATATFTVDEYSSDNLQKFLFGSKTTINGATVSSETVVARTGKYVSLARANLTSFTSLTNAAASTTYVNGTDYTVNLASGLIYIKSSGAIVDAQSLRANYVAATLEQVTAFTASTQKEYYLFFEGLNQAEDNKPVLIDVYRFRPKPIQSIELITDDFGQLEIEGMVLYDGDRADNTTDGGFFKIRLTQAS